MLFRIPVFRRMWAAITVSSLGDWLGLLANTALAQQLTKDESLGTQGVAISGVILVRLLPDLLLGPVAGALADRLDRRKVVIFGEIAAGCLYISIAFAYELVWLYVAQFLIEAVGLFTMASKQAIWVNIVPPERLPVANQLSLISVYGAVPVASLIFAGLATVNRFFQPFSASFIIENAEWPIVIALVFNGLTFFVSSATVFLMRKKIPAYTGERAQSKNIFSLIAEGVSFLRSHSVMRALYVGILGAFVGGGLTVGVAQLYVNTLEAGTAGYSMLFGIVFTGLAVGLLFGPRVMPTVSRRRIFAVSIGCAGLALTVMSFLRDFIPAATFAFLVGFFAGMAWIIGYTLMGQEVEDRLRGRVFAFVMSSVRVILLLTVAVGPALAGLFGSHVVQLGGVRLVFTGPGLTLLLGGVLAILVSVYASRQVGAHSWSRLVVVLRRTFRRPGLLTAQRTEVGLFLAVEGPDLAVTARQTALLAEALRADGYRVAETREPSDTPAGRRIRELLSSGESLSGLAVEAETAALLSAADRAEHVAQVIRPALDRGEVVVCDRYVDSSLAFHGAGRGLDLDRILRTSNWGTGGLVPDLTVVVDEPLADSGGAGHPLIGPVRQTFRDQADTAPDRYVVVEQAADAEPGEAPAGVLERVRVLLASRRQSVQRVDEPGVPDAPDAPTADEQPPVRLPR